VSDFASIQLTQAVENAFAQDGISAPTPIQTAAMGEVLAGRHVVIESGTGTGKTLAYLLPVLQRLAASPDGRTVIMAPSAELAVQTLGVARRYRQPTVSVAGAIAGGSHKKAKGRLQKSTRLVVGSPGRVLELFSERKLKGVTTLVLDEPDPILVGDTPRALRELLSRPEPKVQLILVGASLGPKTERLLSDVLGTAAVRVRAAQEPLKTHIRHFLVRVHPDQREVDVARFIEAQKCSRAIVFLTQPGRIRHLFRYLDEHGQRPATLSEERAKQQRRAALDAFAAGKSRVLLTTDAAARGIDVREVDWVLHYDLPTSAPAYLHRAGRTGRAGREGTSVSFVTDRERATLQRFLRELDVECKPFPRR
jgi:superfamily II DNA/RNA helicase